MTLWYHLNVADPGYAALVQQMQTDHESRGTQNFSNTLNIAGTESFAKVQGAQPGDYTSAAIVRVYDSSNHATCPIFDVQDSVDWVVVDPDVAGPGVVEEVPGDDIIPIDEDLP